MNKVYELKKKHWNSGVLYTCIALKLLLIVHEDIPFIGGLNIAKDQFTLLLVFYNFSLTQKKIGW